VALERQVLQEALKHPGFAAAWELATTVKKFFDSGRGFLSEVFLADQLLAWPMEFGKLMILQFFPGGHGKTLVDGVIFGNAGMGGALAAAKKLMMIRTTAELLAFCIKRKERHVSQAGNLPVPDPATMNEERMASIRKKQAKADSAAWLFSIWTPPTKNVGQVLKMSQAGLLKHLCWSSTPPNASSGGFVQNVTVRLHGCWYDPKIPGKILHNNGDAKTGYKRHRGNPSHAQWHQADEECAVTAPADEKTMEAKRVAACGAMSVAINNLSQSRSSKRVAPDQRTAEAKKKKLQDAPCTGQVKLLISSGLYSDARMSKEKLVDEANAHKLSMPHNASKRTVGKLLKQHFNKFHKDKVNQAVQRTKATSLVDFFTSKGEKEKGAEQVAF
jgi:hypothetical protein